MPRNSTKSIEPTVGEDAENGDSSQEESPTNPTRGNTDETRNTSVDDTATTSALSSERPTALRRSTRGCRANNCVKCTHLVRKKDDGLLCDFCGKWEHLECSPVGVRLHTCLQDSKLEQVLYICTVCHNLRKRGITPTLLELPRGAPATRQEEDVTATQSSSVLRTLRSRIINRQNLDVSNLDTENYSESSSGDDSDVTVIAVEPQNPSGSLVKTGKKKSKTKASVSLERDSTNLPEPTSDEDGSSGWITVSRKQKTRARDSSDDQTDSEMPPNNRLVSFPPRENCVMLFKLPESEDPSPSVRYDDDIRTLGSLVNKLLDPDDPGITVQRVVRIGRKTEGPQQRPLKVVLSNRSEAELLLSRGRRLTGTSWIMKPDLSPEDRERQRAAVQRLRELQAQGKTNWTIRNFRVVRKKLHKKPVTLRAEQSRALSLS